MGFKGGGDQRGEREETRSWALGLTASELPCASGSMETSGDEGDPTEIARRETQDLTLCFSNKRDTYLELMIVGLAR